MNKYLIKSVMFWSYVNILSDLFHQSEKEAEPAVCSSTTWGRHHVYVHPRVECEKTKKINKSKKIKSSWLFFFPPFWNSSSLVCVPVERQRKWIWSSGWDKDCRRNLTPIIPCAYWFLPITPQSLFCRAWQVGVNVACGRVQRTHWSALTMETHQRWIQTVDPGFLVTSQSAVI